MVRTRAGYTGGTTQNPTYRNLGDHTESLQVDFDPTKTSYEKLLAVFWKTPNSCEQAGSRQYRTAVFWNNDTQKRLAEASRDREAARRGRKVATALEPLGTFYLAEGYHQKFFLRRNGPLFRELQALYPREQEFLRSTAAARVNGYLGGHGSYETLEKDIGSFGLSPEGRRTLLEVVRQRP